MSEDVYESLLEQASGAFFFCIALTVILTNIGHTNAALKAVKRELYTNEVMYSQKNPEDEMSSGIISREQLIAYMMKDLTYTVFINNMRVDAEEYNYLNFDFSSLPKGEYKVTNLYDNDGNLVAIKYDLIS